MWPGAGASVFVGRRDEVSSIRELVDGVARGRGGCALVIGEPGIGKSSLLWAGLAPASQLGCEVLWARADEADQRFPLRVMLDCLRVGARSEDPMRARAAALLRGEGQVPGGFMVVGDPALAMVERLLELVDRLCAAAPLVLVIDDLQWADDGSLLVWQRLCRAAEQAPLLLVGACRPVPRREELDRLRRVLTARGGVALSLEPLPAADVSELVGALVGAPAGPELLRAAAQAAGNPLYVRELVDALLRDNSVEVGEGRAELTGEADVGSVPATLSAVLADRLGFLSQPSRDVLRVAALLGSEFSVADLATVYGGDTDGLMAALEEAVAAGVVDASGPRLRFRHALIRQALHEAIPVGLRLVMQQRVARTLAEAGAPAEDVARQLLKAPVGEDTWVLDWLVANAPALVYRAPRIAAELLERTVAQVQVDDARRDRLERAFIGAAYQLGLHEQLERYARSVLSRTANPDAAAEIVLALAPTLLRNSRFEESLAAIRDVAGDSRLAPVWSCRLRSLEAVILSVAARHEEAEPVARRALADGERIGDPLAIGHARHVLALESVSHGDYLGSLEHNSHGLSILGDDSNATDLRLLMSSNRAMVLMGLDRFAEAEQALYETRVLADRIGATYRIGWLHVFAALLYYRIGRWDDATTELESVTELPDAQSFPLIYHGLAALIATHRDDAAEAKRQLDAVQDWRIETASSRLNSGYLVPARAMVAERQGRPEEALALLAMTLNPEYDGDYGGSRHDWMSYLARLALAIGDRETAQAATRTSVEDAGRFSSPPFAQDAQRCVAMVDGDVERLLEVGAYYQKVGRLLEFGEVLEDAAMQFAQLGAGDRARALLGDAVEVYGKLGAAWDIRRADTRARSYGVRRGQRGPRRRPTTGWPALTPTEVRVAELVGKGCSNPEIAAELFLSRRTVQTHVSHILAKLAVRSRFEIALHVAEQAQANTPPTPA